MREAIMANATAVQNLAAIRFLEGGLATGLFNAL
jgi:hypothetical protein